jgi:hypothetical protein
MTSNIGARKLKDFGTGVGFGTSAKAAQESDYAKGVIENALKKAFAPEFLNRIDDVVIFNPLGIEDIHLIIDIELSKLSKRIDDLGYKLILTKKAKDYIKGKTVLKLESSDSLAFYYGRQALLERSILTPMEFFKRVDDVSIEDILRVSKELFIPKNLNLAMIGPFENENRFKDLLRKNI